MRKSAGAGCPAATRLQQSLQLTRGLHKLGLVRLGGEGVAPLVSNALNHGETSSASNGNKQESKSTIMYKFKHSQAHWMILIGLLGRMCYVLYSTEHARDRKPLWT